MDAVQIMLNCTLAKGNTIIWNHGKQVYTVILMFQLGDLLIRLVDAAFPMMTEMPSGSLSGDLRFVRRLNRRVFLFDLMNFAVNAGSEGVTDLADGFICLKLQLSFVLRLFSSSSK